MYDTSSSTNTSFGIKGWQYRDIEEKLKAGKGNGEYYLTQLSADANSDDVKNFIKKYSLPAEVKAGEEEIAKKALEAKKKADKLRRLRQNK